MARIHVNPLLALIPFMLLAPTALAQSTTGPRIQQSVDGCQPSSASRTRSRSRSNCEREQARATVEKELKITVELDRLESLQCEATSTTQYQQRNTIARVDTAVAVADCTKASGELTVAARVRDASGEVKSLEFPETWQRNDGEDVKLTADYPIGENVDLLSVRVRGLNCTCADTAADAVAGAPPATPPN